MQWNDDYIGLGYKTKESAGVKHVKRAIIEIYAEQIAKKLNNSEIGFHKKDEQKAHKYAMKDGD